MRRRIRRHPLRRCSSGATAVLNGAKNEYHGLQFRRRSTHSRRHFIDYNVNQFKMDCNYGADKSPSVTRHGEVKQIEIQMRIVDSHSTLRKASPCPAPPLPTLLLIVLASKRERILYYNINHLFIMAPRLKPLAATSGCHFRPPLSAAISSLLQLHFAAIDAVAATVNVEKSKRFFAPFSKTKNQKLHMKDRQHHHIPPHHVALHLLILMALFMTDNKAQVTQHKFRLCLYIVLTI